MWCQHTQANSAVGIAWQCDSYSTGRWESCDRPLGIISTLTCTALAGISTELQPWKLCCHMLSVFPAMVNSLEPMFIVRCGAWYCCNVACT